MTVATLAVGYTVIQLKSIQIKGGINMRFWDNDFDRAFDKAVEELFWEEKAKQAMKNINIANSQKLIGAQ